MKTDEEHMHEYTQGSEAALRSLYGKYSPLTYGFIHRRLRSSEAEDFYQKVWRQVHEKRHLYKGQPFAPWFFILMEQLLNDRYHFLGRQKSKVFRDELIEKIHQQELSQNELDELLLGLPPDTRELVQKYYLRGEVDFIKKEFLEFLTIKKDLPVVLKELTEKDIRLSFKKRGILTKFFLLQFIGMIVSLLICPQFGIGLSSEIGLFHYVHPLGTVVLAIFCGSFFIGTGLAMISFGMKREELWWVWHRYKYILIVLPLLLWGGFMLTNLTLDLSSETAVFHFFWILGAILIETIFFQCQNGLYFRKLKSV